MYDIKYLNLGNELYYIGSKNLKNGEYIYYISSKQLGGSFELRTSEKYNFEYLEPVYLQGEYLKCPYTYNKNSHFQIKGAGIYKLNKE
ncbi:hypothetical protein B5723_08065 [Mammaliicoccus sciuri]|uniref:hypothetical protein n=1 Tax=Mammaliicoccus sciuri TaxID=1296 RepID=UPI000A00B996|nr:hypothetical protein [Mammaliicoccus sciuri]ORI02827.1 hypothetical protein B5723_08065 [Mammaliicoccus sciuri]